MQEASLVTELELDAVERLSLADALALGSAVWDSVPAGASALSPFMTWAWHRAWADCAPPAEVQATEVLVLPGGDGSVRALLPMRLCRMRFRRVTIPVLTWAIGDVACPDDLDIPARPDADMSVVAAALESRPWLVLLLSNAAPDAPQVARLSAALVARGHTARRRPLWSCPELALPASWEAYLAGLSANRRQVLRRKERVLRRCHSVALTDYGEDRLEEGWTHLLALHERRWNGGGGAFQDPRATRLQRQFAGEMARQQRLWLTTLDVDGTPAAVWYGFVSDQTVYFYQGGRDPRWERESVGLVLMSLMIQRAIQRGFRAFNFLRGDDAYKRQWTTTERMTEEVVVFRSGWKGRCLRALDALGEARRMRDG